MNLDKKSVLKLCILALFMGVALLLLSDPSVRGALSKENLRSFVNSFGVFGPLVFILLFAVGVILLVPGSIFTAAGAVIFGTLWGTVLNIIGATLGAAGAFFIARTLGREFAQRVAGRKMETYDEKLRKHGFATVFYLRMLLLPFTPLNYGIGLTRVRFRDFIIGTFLGIIPPTFILTFFVSKLTDVKVWTDLLTWDVLLAVVLFGLTFFIPPLMKRFYKRQHILDDKKPS